MYKANFFRLILLVNLLLASDAMAQLLPVWTNTLTNLGDNADRFNKIASDNNGSFIAVGYTLHGGDYRDFLIVKYNALGDTVWTQRFNGIGDGNDEAVDIVCDFLGNSYVTGYSDGGNSNDDILTVAIDASGSLIWSGIYNYALASEDDVPVGIEFDFNTGNVYVAGSSEQLFAGNTNRDYVIIQYSNAGIQNWVQRFDRVSGGRDEVLDLTVDPAGNCIVTGRSSNGSDDDYVTRKYSAAGSLVWSQIFDRGNGDDRATAITADIDANIIVTGRSENSDGDDDYYTIKYNSGGTVRWQKVYAGPSSGNDRALCIASDFNKGIYISGQSDTDPSAITDYDIVSLKYDSSGNLQFTRFDVGAAQQDDIPSRITVDINNNLYITGKSDVDPSTATNNDFITVMYDASGVRQWSNTFNGTRNASDIASDVIVDFAGNIVLVGGVENLGSQKDGALIEYDATGATVFNKSFNGQGDFEVQYRSVVADLTGNVYAVGFIFNEDDSKNCLITKFDPAGSTVWTKQYNGENDDDDEFEALAQDGNGFIYATGYCKVGGQKSNYITIKYDPNTGDTIWTRQYNFTANQADRAVDIIINNANEIFVTGYSDSNPNDTLSNNDVVTICYNAAGATIWSQRFDGTGTLRDEPAEMIFDNAGNIIITGRTENVQNDDYLVLKYSTNGVIQSGFPASFNSPFSNDDRALAVAVDANDNIYITGYTQTGSGAASEDVITVKYSPAGVAEWNVYFDQGGNDRGVDITTDINGNIYITGYTDNDIDPLASNYNMFLISYNNTGGVNWDEFYDGTPSQDDYAVAVHMDNVNRVVLTGYTETGSGPYHNDIMSLIYEAGGSLVYTARFDATGNDDEARVNLCTNTGSLFIGGFSEDAIGQRQSLMMKYDLPQGINQLITQDLFFYPNPSSDLITLNIENEQEQNYEVFDLAGHVVLKGCLNNRQQVDIRNLAPGLYTIRIISNQSVWSGSLSVVR